jgi:diaminohydroxyphosphoribosylaminopyrimidine deaminase/5-amino-6-(5-phosphoribosylamino)uracil reductase
VGKGTVEADNPALSCRLRSFANDTASYFADQPVSFSGSRNSFLARLFAPSFANVERSPVRVCVGLPLPALTLNFFHDTEWLIFEKKSRLSALEGVPGYESLPELVINGRVVPVPDEADTPGFVLKTLGEKGMNFVMLEGGSRLAASFERSGCIDEYLFFIAPKIFGGGRPVMNGEGSASASDARAIQSVSTAFCGGDLVYHGYSQ